MDRSKLRRLLAVLPLVVVTLACGGPTADNVNASAGTPPPGVSGQSISIKETEYTLSPSTLTLKPGTYTVTTTNVGQFPHDLHIATAADGAEVGGSTIVTAGHSAQFTVTLKPGTYAMWCSVNAHRSLGMEGTITVR